jgi:hypothetical protein
MAALLRQMPAGGQWFERSHAAAAVTRAVGQPGLRPLFAFFRPRLHAGRPQTAGFAVAPVGRAVQAASGWLATVKDAYD